MVWKIVWRAVLCHQSTRKITNILKLDIVVRRTQQILSEAPHIQYVKRIPTVKMTVDKLGKGVKCAREYLQWNDIFWKDIVFSDEKKFKLDGPDGLEHYWHDFRQEPEIFSRPVNGGVSVIIYGAISFKRVVVYGESGWARELKAILRHSSVRFTPKNRPPFWQKLDLSARQLLRPCTQKH